MGLRDRLGGNDDPETQPFQMREKLMSFGDDFWIDDFWIEDENGRRAYKVDGKAVRVRDTFRDRDGGRSTNTTGSYRSLCVVAYVRFAPWMGGPAMSEGRKSSTSS